MNIGIVCYASVGGSGIVATELGKVLAVRGHRVHILISDTPARLRMTAPCLGQHSAEILHEMLGYTEEQVVGLEAAGVIV